MPAMRVFSGFCWVLCSACFNSVVCAQSLCYQPAYQSWCCMKEGTDVLPYTDPRCMVYGHQAIRDSTYLQAHLNNPNVTLAVSDVFQEAFLKQGIFNTMYYTDCKNTWLGVTVRQPPQDLMILQQLIYRLRPQLFIETGTCRGGSAYFVATMFELMEMDSARVITIDEVPKESHEMNLCSGTPNMIPVGALGNRKVWQQHVRELVADSLSPVAQTFVKGEIRRLPPGSSIVISLDSNHAAEFVWQEVRTYAPLVPVNSFLVIQDVILGFAKFNWDGPYTAALKLLEAPQHVKRRLGFFVWDRSVEIFGYTGHAYLRRVA